MISPDIAENRAIGVQREPNPFNFFSVYLAERGKPVLLLKLISFSLKKINKGKLIAIFNRWGAGIGNAEKSESLISNCLG